MCRVIAKPLLRALSYRAARPLRDAGLLSRPIGFPKPAASAAERRRIYERDGLVLGGRLLDESRLRRLRAEFERVFAQHANPAARVRVVSSPVPAGHVHFHHHMVWHGSGPDRTRRPRRALAIHCIDADAQHSAHALSDREADA